MDNPSEERRVHPRFDVEEETALLTAPKFILSDNLIDISIGGLSFSYEDREPFHVGVWVQLDIIRDDIAIEEIPAKVVDDIEMPHSPKFSRRCGVEFGTLSKFQQQKVAFLVKKFAA
jgi:c-di-GMP-binding flagellar brake protein YcgR